MCNPQYVGLVTAAGKSTRMGGFPKPLLHIDGQRFVERLIDTYHAAGIEDVIVVIGYEAAEVRRRADLSGATVIENDQYVEGMLSSVRVGVEAAAERDADSLFLSPVDYPLIPVEAVSAVVEAAAESSADIIHPTTNGGRGHPPLFRASTFEALRNAPADEGARAVVYADETDTVDLPVDDERIFVDVDTPAEYWDAVKRFC